VNAPQLQPPPEPVKPEWKWSWNPMIGIMYGPVPVGLIIAIPILIAIFAK
jgi:hypothetical protein